MIPQIRRLLIVLSVAFVWSMATAHRAGSDASPRYEQKPVVPVGLFIGAIEEGARIFTPVRLLPFEHPEAEGHEFPNALQLHQSEYEALVWLGEQVGLKLAATLQRYPKPPVAAWGYEAFAEVPVDAIKQATVHRRQQAASPLPGLKAVAFHDGVPVCFIVDTRGLTLRERGMDRPTTMGLDLTRAQFLAGLHEIGNTLTGAGSSVVTFED